MISQALVHRGHHCFEVIHLALPPQHVAQRPHNVPMCG
eukprot:CAMPEP_0202871390 /NCGR_PEP_ID=MMETSP1391-20130828/18521_1 /ASSEMBLY_ACC=CAM_ASM_000867 /TAXON_ID=1034604 /ORGANISM="Chlamydomonas leiostraca, Strain SAG 11-49" /LENGTH=37 /DNA_ID= /DNA_START= /DNA_END= /DNA_ORIENTATION=